MTANSREPAPIWYQTSTPPTDESRDLPPLLFVHGDFSTAEMSWSRQWAGLKERRSLILIDRRGHGHSPSEPRPYTLAQDAQDLLDVVGRLGLATVALVAHSYGAIVALETARRAPNVAHALHLVEPPYLSLLPDDPDVAGLERGARSLHDQAQSLTPEALTERFFSAVIGSQAVRELMEKPVWEAIVREAPRFAAEEFVGEYPADRLLDLPSDIPVSIYTGGRSHPGLRRLAHVLHERLPHSELISFPEAGHDVQRIGAPFDEALSRGVSG